MKSQAAYAAIRCVIEYVFKPSRRDDRGKRVTSRYFSGRYSLRRGEPPVTVGLDTTEERVARKRLRDLVAAKQLEAEGIISPTLLRESAAVPLLSLVSEYESDLAGRVLRSGHAKETVARIRRIIRETGWKHLRDIRPDAFVRWRSSFRGAAKTKKEYQGSLHALLAWLCRMDRLNTNPLSKVDRVDVRGKAVRESRAFTPAEFGALCRVAPLHRLVAYLFLAFTGCRKNEARTLLWQDITFAEKSIATFRAHNVKGKKKRTVPLKRDLADRLLAYRKTLPPEETHVFPVFPSDDALHADLLKAGIERKDTAGRVVHFHAFRKTTSSWGAPAGVSQRAAQEILGHSTPTLTANAYTDVAALQLHSEIEKLPWIDDAQPNAHENVRSHVRNGFRELLTNIINRAVSELETGISASLTLAARHGFEP